MNQEFLAQDDVADRAVYQLGLIAIVRELVRIIAISLHQDKHQLKETADDVNEVVKSVSTMLPFLTPLQESAEKFYSCCKHQLSMKKRTVTGGCAK